MKNQFSNGDYLEVMIISADLIKMLDDIAHNNITVSNVTYFDEFHLLLSISFQDLADVQKILKKRGDELEIKGRFGRMFYLRTILRRPVLLAGIIMPVLLALWLPTRIFFVEVEGCEIVPARLVLEQAESCGVRFFASSRAVRSEKIKNALLSQLPQLQWVGVNTYGCTAVITVRERNDLASKSLEPIISHIVACYDAVIGEITVMQGSALCQPGQAVKSGQILVSGYTDCGICIKATQAKAEVYGETLRNLTVFSPTDYLCRIGKVSSSRKYSLVIGKKRINFFKGSGISGTTCAKIYGEKYITLPGGFVLPIAIGCETVITYTSEVQELFVDSSLSEFAGEYITDQMISGSVLQSEQTIQTLDGYCRLDGIYRCYEIIGITRVEERIAQYE